jgi:broad specificity phosphatase PhoE
MRTRQTTDKIVEGLGYAPKVVVEERLREIDFGILDGLSPEGVKIKYPEEVARRAKEGKYWYRAPGGESRPDVRERVHGLLGTVTRDYAGKRIVMVAHSVVVLVLRALLERWGEDDYMKVDKEDDVKNCSLTTYVFDPSKGEKGKLVLQEYNTIVYNK